MVLEFQHTQTVRPSLFSSILREQRDFKSRILQATTHFKLLLVHRGGFRGSSFGSFEPPSRSRALALAPHTPGR